MKDSRIIGWKETAYKTKLVLSKRFAADGTITAWEGI